MANDLFSYLLENAPPDMCMIDIGSKKGKWLVPFVENFPQAKFVCFEALTDQYETLKNRYKNFPNVACYNCVISDKNLEFIKFYKDLVRPGWSGIKTHEYMTDYEELNLPSNNLDSFNLKPYCIKIDVEGAELLVLKGAVNSLEYAQVVFFECNEVHYKNYNYKSSDLYDFLNEKNFLIFTDDLQYCDKEQFIFLTDDKRRYENPKGFKINFIAFKKDTFSKHNHTIKDLQNNV